MNQFQHQTIEDEELVFPNDVHNYLGPELVLKRCRLVLRTVARGLTITDATLIDCRIDVKKTLSNCQSWCGAVLSGCTFSGRMSGNDFGHWPAQHPGGRIENCDFSAAELDGRRFMGCAADTITYPKWPCFSIVRPYERRREIESFDWPEGMRIWALVAAESLEITAALTDHAPTLAKRCRCGDDEIRAALVRFGDVVM